MFPSLSESETSNPLANGTCVLTVQDRITLGYGSIVSAGLSIIGALGTVLMIFLKNRASKKKLLQDSLPSSPSSSGHYRHIIPKQQTLHSLNSSNDNTTNTTTTNNNNKNNVNNEKFGEQTIEAQNTFVPILKKYKGPNSSSEALKVSRLVNQMAFSDLLSALFVLASRILFIKFNGHFVHTNGSLRDISLCSGFSGAIGFSFLSSFFWTTIVSFHIYRLFILPVKNRYFMVYYCLICWLIPLSFGLVLMSSASITHAHDMSWCTMNRWTVLVLFYLPLVLNVIASIIFLIKVKRHLNSLSRAFTSFNTIQNRIVLRLNLFVIGLVVCWTFNIIAFLVFLMGNSCQNFYLEFLSNFLSPLQGFLNFISYTISNRKSVKIVKLMTTFPRKARESCFLRFGRNNSNIDNSSNNYSIINND